MLNFFTTGLLTTCVSLACVCSAQACGGACGGAMSHATASAKAAPVDPHANMQMSQTPGTRTYQSFSYEPQATPAPVLVTPRPMMMSRPSYQGGRFDAPYLHGDSKASGRYQWNAR